MRAEQQEALVKRIFGRLDGHVVPSTGAVLRQPVAAYVSPERLKHEQRLLFKQRMLPVTLSCRIANPGDYITDDLSGVPILLVRDDEGAARAFLNACRHRGARLVVDAEGVAASFSCPYHGWTYDRQGCLRRVFPLDAFSDLQPQTLSLIRLPTIERHGLIWVSLAPTSLADDSPLGLLDDEIAHYGFHRFNHFDTVRLTPKANWKLIVEGFLENWHFGTLHRSTIAPIFISSLGLVDSFDPHQRIVYPRRSILELRGQANSTLKLLPHSVVIYLLFPSTLLVWQGDHLEVWRIHPDPGGDPSRCVAEASLYTSEPAKDDKARGHWERNRDLLMRTVVGEDFPVVEGIQASLTSGLASTFLFGANERGLQLFQKNIADLLGADACSEDGVNP